MTHTTCSGMLVIAFILSACGDCHCRKSYSDDSVGSIILIRDGEMRESPVYKIASYCWVTWYEEIEKLNLTRSGTIRNGPFVYHWTYDIAGPENAALDQQWFDANCLEPPQ